ncbi:MAG TPA: hypothetical protein VGE77_04740, partial [Nocardioides sp.]
MSPDPDSSDLPDLPRLAELHRELNRTATGGVDDPRSARSVLPPLAPPGSAAIPLPEVALPSADLAATLAARRSAYRYGATPPTLTD